MCQIGKRTMHQTPPSTPQYGQEWNTHKEFHNLLAAYRNVTSSLYKVNYRNSAAYLPRGPSPLHCLHVHDDLSIMTQDNNSMYCGCKHHTQTATCMKSNCITWESNNFELRKIGNHWLQVNLDALNYSTNPYSHQSNPIDQAIVFNQRSVTIKELGIFESGATL